jgi:hypothetical protein
MTPLLAPHVTLTVSPLLYRRHLLRPDVLPLLMARSGYLLTDTATEWAVIEGAGPFLADVNDFELDFPNQSPLSGPVAWHLAGAATAALLALQLITDDSGEGHV